jgi:hypothetical protein
MSGTRGTCTGLGVRKERSHGWLRCRERCLGWGGACKQSQEHIAGLRRDSSFLDREHTIEQQQKRGIVCTLHFVGWKPKLATYRNECQVSGHDGTTEELTQACGRCAPRQDGWGCNARVHARHRMRECVCVHPPALMAQLSGSLLCGHHRHSEQCHAQSTLWCCRGQATLVSSVAWQQGVRPTERTDSMPARGDNELHATCTCIPQMSSWATHAQPITQQRAIREDATGSPGVGESFGNVQTEEP